MFRIPGRPRDPDRGQAMVEFAVVLPILVLILVGIMQFGLLFWTQITLTQIARDTGRWAATQQACAQGSGSSQADVVGEAHAIADSAQLFEFSGPGDPDLTVTPSWEGTPCPPVDNSTVAWVNVDMTYRVGVFVPFLAESCSPSCHRILSTEVQFRMEPEPAP